MASVPRSSHSQKLLAYATKHASFRASIEDVFTLAKPTRVASHVEPLFERQLALRVIIA